MILPAVIVWLAFSGFITLVMMMQPWGTSQLQAWAELEGLSLSVLVLLVFVSWLSVTAPLAFLYWVALRGIFG